MNPNDKYGKYGLGNNSKYHDLRVQLILSSIDVKAKSILDIGAGFCDIIVSLLDHGAKKGLAYECSPVRLKNKKRMKTHPNLELITKEFPCAINGYFDIGMILGNTAEFFQVQKTLDAHRKIFDHSNVFIIEAKPRLVSLVKREAKGYYKSFTFISRTIITRELWIFSEKVKLV